MKLRTEKAVATARELKLLCAETGVMVSEFQANKHYRLAGKTAVDYWPSTGRAWLVGHYGPAQKMSIPDVVTWAATGIRA